MSERTGPTRRGTRHCRRPDELLNNAELRKKPSPLKAFVEGAIKAELLFKPGTK